MDSKFHSTLRAQDTHDVKQKIFFFLLFKENLLGIVSRLLFFCFTSSVSGTQNKCLNSHHNYPRMDGLNLIGNLISACRLISGNNILLMEYV